MPFYTDIVHRLFTYLVMDSHANQNQAHHCLHFVKWSICHILGFVVGTS